MHSSSKTAIQVTRITSIIRYRLHFGIDTSNNQLENQGS